MHCIRIQQIFSVILQVLFIIFSVEAYAYSSHNFTLTRVAEKSVTTIGKPIKLIVSAENFEIEGVRGLFYTENIPVNLTVETLSVKVDGIEITNYIYEYGWPGDVYSGLVPHRWIVEIPPDFLSNNSVINSLEIVFSITSPAFGEYTLTEYNYVGYYLDKVLTERPFWGFNEQQDNITVLYTFPGDIDGNGLVDIGDAIVSLQILAGIDPGAEINIDADINGDGMINIPEVIYLLQLE